MKKAKKAFTDTVARNARCPVGKALVRIAAGHGLNLQVDADGRKRWRLRYRIGVAQRMLALGNYPSVSLKDARQRAQAPRALIAQGIDPVQARRSAKAANVAVAMQTFGAWARRWLDDNRRGWSPSMQRWVGLVVERYLTPGLGERPMADLLGAEVAVVLKRLATHAPSLVPKAAWAAGAIARAATAAGVGPTHGLPQLDAAKIVRNHGPEGWTAGHDAAPVTPRALADAVAKIRAIDNGITRAALLVGLYTAQRPGNVVAMRWADVDAAKRAWVIPAAMMKVKGNGRGDHTVPLSRQALAAIETMRPWSGAREYVFSPLASRTAKHLDRDNLSRALREAGLGGVMVAHGWRAAFRTLARERLGASVDVLEAVLAHAKRGPLRDAYDRASFIDERRRLMQRWADFVDAPLAPADNVVRLHAAMA